MSFYDYVINNKFDNSEWRFDYKNKDYKWIGYNLADDFKNEFVFSEDFDDVMNFITRPHGFRFQKIIHKDHGCLFKVERVNDELIFEGLENILHIMKQCEKEDDIIPLIEILLLRKELKKIKNEIEGK